MPPNSDPVVAADAVTVRFGSTEVLRGLSLRADRGRVTALLGPNGAGKTTFLRCCTGLIAPSGGSLRVLAERPGTPAVTARVGLMPQSTGAWSGIRAADLLRYLAGLYAHPLPVEALIERLGIGTYADIPYRRLSGGQQQTVNLAGALVGRPELVFLDEPTAGLDPHARRTSWDLVRELRASGVSVVLTTHAMDEAAALADEVVIVDRGRVAVSGTVADLTADGTSLEDVFLRHTHAEAGR
ncbi:ABC transporter ATP-binding protein [Microlunatus ginsengisoli]|uniref:ABC transporter domain-containing protein n=1 Tax=Microlunatus ginsengisoli TaxID=363863 RepID=A0ABP7A8M0_9ACTN